MKSFIKFMTATILTATLASSAALADYGPPVPPLEYVNGNTWTLLRVADTDCDGIDDLIGYIGTSTWVWESGGTNPRKLTDQYLRAITFGDLDGDGCIDILGSIETSGTWVYTADNPYNPRRLTQSVAWSIEVGDYDNDGIDDAALSEFTNTSGVPLPGLYIAYGVGIDVDDFPAPTLYSPAPDINWSDTGATHYRVFNALVSGTGSTWVVDLTREEAACNGSGCYFYAPPQEYSDTGLRNLRIINLDADGTTGGISNVLVYGP